jgi:hypothetical protein
LSFNSKSTSAIKSLHGKTSEMIVVSIVALQQRAAMSELIVICFASHIDVLDHEGADEQQSANEKYVDFNNTVSCQVDAKVAKDCKQQLTLTFLSQPMIPSSTSAKLCNNVIDGGTVLLSTAAKICLNGYVTQATPLIFCDKPRRLIVEYFFLIPNSAGAWTHQAQLSLSTKPNNDFVMEFIPILIFDGA